MKYFFLIISLNLNCFGANFDQFAAALAKVESNNNPKAIGDGGRAKGILQIHEICFIDAAKYDKDLAKYKYSDCFNPQVSKRVLWAYCARYELKALKEGNFEVLARLWNGGCGWRTKTGKVKSNLDNYWNNVSKNLN